MAEPSGADIRGILFDLDGVLYVGSTVIDGALETLAMLRRRAIPCRFLTNTSTLAHSALHRKIIQLGFDIPPTEIISAPQAAVRWLRAHGSPPCGLLLSPEVQADFAEFPRVEIETAEVLVLGDIGDAWSYPLLNRLFNRLMQGATLLAIHRNRFWQTEQGLCMDIGGFVAALEYCSGATPVVTGKPATEFFQIALADLGVSAAQAIVVGDDIDSDIGGAQACGIRGVLVKTGKYRSGYAAASTVQPYALLDSVRDLPRWLGFAPRA